MSTISANDPKNLQASGGVIYSSAKELAARIKRRELSAVEVLNAHLAQISEHNGRVKAVVTLDEDAAARRAEAADAALACGEDWGPLHGVPVTVKDVHSVKGVRSTWAGFPAFSNRIPDDDSAVPAKLRAAGANIIGLTNAALLGERSLFPRTNNPWDLERSASGSSAGSAAAVAAGFVPFDIGNDSVASILRPASFCGVFGMRPTEHRVSNARSKAFGLQHTWLPLTVQGPLARTVADLELALSVISGPDGRDADVPPLPWQPRPPITVVGTSVAWASALPGMPVAKEIRVAIAGVAAKLEQAGARVAEAIPILDFVGAHELTWQFMRFEWDEVFRDPIMGWTAVDAPQATFAEFRGAQYRRERLVETWEQFLTGYDLLLYPITATPANRQGDGEIVIDGQRMTEDEFHLVSEAISPLTGLPAVVIPLGIDADGLPIAAQLIGHRWQDERLLGFAAEIEALTGGFRRPPGY